MSAYVRPRWVKPIYRDDAGAVIDYGSRWDQNGPDADTYGVDTHPERFAPLHVIADALVEHLVESYDVQIDRDLASAQDFLRPMDLCRCVRLTPSDPAAASMTFGFTNYPGLIVHAGLLHDFDYPRCGCDACDETADSQAELLEGQVMAVVAGFYRETYTPDADLPLGLALGSEQMGGQGGRSTADGIPADLLATGVAKLRRLPDGWAAWPRKA